MSFVYNFYQYFTPNGVDLQTNFIQKDVSTQVALGGVQLIVKWQGGVCTPNQAISINPFLHRPEGRNCTDLRFFDLPGHVLSQTHRYIKQIQIQ